MLVKTIYIFKYSIIIVELFRKNWYKSLAEGGDTIFNTTTMLQLLWHDLILLENQLPWMVLQKLFDLTVTPVDEMPLVKLAIDFFSTIMSIDPALADPGAPDQNGHKHILDLLRNSLILSSSVHRSPHEFQYCSDPVPSATILEEYGIEFNRADATSVLDIRFNKRNGILEIPLLLNHESTETLFRNVISLEQLCPDYEPIFTSYAHFWGNLINTTRDMEIISRSWAFGNWMDIQNVDFFNKLFIGSVESETHYGRLNNEINDYCRRAWPRYRMLLTRHYFHNPWKTISLSVAAFLAICSFIQTFYTINNHHLWEKIFLIVLAVLVACSFSTIVFTVRR